MFGQYTRTCPHVIAVFVYADSGIAATQLLQSVIRRARSGLAKPCVSKRARQVGIAPQNHRVLSRNHLRRNDSVRYRPVGRSIQLINLSVVHVVIAVGIERHFGHEVVKALHKQFPPLVIRRRSRGKGRRRRGVIHHCHRQKVHTQLPFLSVHLDIRKPVFVLGNLIKRYAFTVGIVQGGIILSLHDVFKHVLPPRRTAKKGNHPQGHKRANARRQTYRFVVFFRVFTLFHIYYFARSTAFYTAKYLTKNGELCYTYLINLIVKKGDLYE